MIEGYTSGHRIGQTPGEVPESRCESETSLSVGFIEDVLLKKRPFPHGSTLFLQRYLYLSSVLTYIRVVRSLRELLTESIYDRQDNHNAEYSAIQPGTRVTGTDNGSVQWVKFRS